MPELIALLTLVLCLARLRFYRAVPDPDLEWRTRLKSLLDSLHEWKGYDCRKEAPTCPERKAIGTIRKKSTKNPTTSCSPAMAEAPPFCVLSPSASGDRSTSAPTSRPLCDLVWAKSLSDVASLERVGWKVQGKWLVWGAVEGSLTYLMRRDVDD